MTILNVPTIDSVSRRSPPISSAKAKLRMSLKDHVLSTGILSADDEARAPVLTNEFVPRRRLPSSGDSKAMLRVPTIHRLPTESPEPSSLDAVGLALRDSLNFRARTSREPSSTGADGHHAGDTPHRIAAAPVEPSSDGDAANMRLSTTVCLPTSSEPYVTEAVANIWLPTTFHLPSAFGHTLSAIRELDRQRDDLLRAEGNMTRQVKAICRRAVDLRFEDVAKVRATKMKQADSLYASLQGGDLDAATAIKVGSTMPLLDARKAIGAACSKVERLLVKQVQTLPVHESFVLKVNGFGALGLGQIIGKCGDLNLYANPAKVWKRMGMGLVGNERQRKHLDAAKALEHGYSPRRRSTMFVIGDSMLKKQSPYRDLYLQRKEFEIAKAKAAGITIVKSGDDKPVAGSKTMSQMHVHRRAQRYMEKRLLRDLWRAWTGRGAEHTTTENP